MNRFLNITVACILMASSSSLAIAQSNDEREVISYYDEVNKKYYHFEIDSETGGLIFFDKSYEMLGAESGTYEGTINIPDYVEYNDKQWTVTKIRAFIWSYSLNSVEIPGSVTEIYDSFNHCSVPTVKINNGNLHKIDGAFNQCEDLKQIVLPESIQIINSSFYDNCLENIELPGSVVNAVWAFNKSNDLKRIDLNMINTVSDRSFSDCPKLEMVTVNSSTDYIDGCFNDCPLLNRVEIKTFQPGLKIKDSFNNCPAIKEVALWAEFIPFSDFENSFKDMDFANATLYIPEGNAEAYKQDPQWSRFGRIIDNLPAGVDEVESTGAAAVGRFNVNGNSVDENYKGICIVRERKDDGTISIHKEMIR